VTSVPETGVYWFQLAAGVPANTQAIVIRLNGLPQATVVYSTTTNFPSDVMVRDIIQNVSSTDQLMVINRNFSIFGTKNKVTGTSLLGYRLDNIMIAHVYFSIQCIATSIAQQIVITFDRILINVGSAWNTTNNTFTAPYDGSYFSFAVGISGTNSLGISVMLNESEVSIHDTSFNNIITS
jgi:hypothetical protein